MIPRPLEERIVRSLDQFPVVGLVGSRQSGKTTLARALASRCGRRCVYLDLERPSDLARLSEPEFYLEQHSDALVVLDEIQRRPDLFPILRALADARQRPGCFLILGSASPARRRQSAESLAGRIVYHELSPLELREVGPAHWRKLWLRGGYPSSFLARVESHSTAWRAAFIDTYLERDLPALGVRVPSPQLRRFWEMLAHSHGQLWNASKPILGRLDAQPQNGPSHPYHSSVIPASSGDRPMARVMHSAGVPYASGVIYGLTDPRPCSG